MKTKILQVLFSFILLVGISTSFAFKFMNCDGYYATTKGIRIELTEFDEKNKVTGKTVSEVIDSKTVGNKTIAKVKSSVTDLKKNKTTESIIDVECDGTSVVTNTIKLIEENLKKSNQLGQSTASGNNPIIPNNLSVGQKLPDANISISIKGEISLESSVKLFDRKVVAMEKVTVPGGTFDCAVITFTEEDKILFNKVKKIKVWLAKGVGIVKSEEYDKKDKLKKRTELSSISQ